MRPKKVAIIGAGPSGLVTAKTLLHNFSRGTFSPIIFDSRHEVGGLWPHPPSSTGAQRASGAATLDPLMRTNLSRFTVAFSDLSWESALEDVDVPMFPQARQVGQYLAAYTDRYIPKEVLRLGHRVTRAVRTAEAGSTARWGVEWSQVSSCGISSRPNDVGSEDFDFLVVASGYFARPFVPDIPGLEQFSGQIIHSSALHKGRDLFPDNDGTGSGNIVIVGGSMSGVEAASAAALWKSSSVVSRKPITSNPKRAKVHHVYSRPMWTLPTYLPQETSEETVSFLPLDLAMYDLGRRPPGPIDYALGPIPEEKATKTNSYFHSLLGVEYEQFGHMHQPLSQQPTSSRPPWVAISNDYAEFIRSGAIDTTMGRVVSGSSDPDKGRASIKIEMGNGESETLDDVTVIVMATGFTPFESLSFLPTDVLQALEYTTDDAFLPLVLDKGGTLRSEMPDIGFVGFYRGPYWGVMEMQARFLGEELAGQQLKPVQTGDQRESVRILRLPDTNARRGQFPMGDYVGLMESFAQDLDIQRTQMPGRDSRSGPVIPARYLHGQDQTLANAEVQQTLDALHTTLAHDHRAAQAGAALAIFRALHGDWKVTQTIAASGEEVNTGAATFYPRFPADPAYDREYVCEEHLEIQKSRSNQTSWSVLRLSEAGASENSGRIEIWSTDAASRTTSPVQLVHSLRLTPFYRKKKDGEYLPGEYVIYARAFPPDGPAEEDTQSTYQYIFNFGGVSISSWECIEVDGRLDESGSGSPAARSRKSYER